MFTCLISGASALITRPMHELISHSQFLSMYCQSLSRLVAICHIDVYFFFDETLLNILLR